MTKVLYFIRLFYFADARYLHPHQNQPFVMSEKGNMVPDPQEPLQHVYGQAKLHFCWAKYIVICVFQHEAATPESGLKVFFENRCNIEPLIFFL